MTVVETTTDVPNPAVDPTAPIVTPPLKPHQVNFTPDKELDRNAERLFRMTEVISKFAGTLALRPIKVDLSHDYNVEAPAWSDSDSITFVAKKVGDLTEPIKVTSLKGLSLHEISHIMLTPRSGSVLAKNVQKAKLWPAFNALEDQRIETFMTAKFSSVSDWLIATIAQHLLDKPTQLSISFPLVHGRKYLPIEIRKVVRDSYERQDHVAELSKLIDRYVVLNLGDSKNYPEAFDIIQKYHNLVSQLPPANPDYPYHNAGWDRVKDPNGHHDRKHGELKSSSSKPLSKAQQEAMAGRVVIPSDEYGDDLDKTMESPLGSVPLAGHGGDPSQVLQAAVDKVLQVRKREIVQNIKQFSGDASLTAKELPTLPRHEYVYEEAVTPSMILASKSFANQLQLLRAEHDPGWLRKQEQGKLNVQRYVTGCDVDEAFDQWDMGREDALDIEAVILLDISGSMGWTIRSAYESMWAIKRALDKIGASTTVLTFGSTARTLYSSDERASTKMKYAYTESSTEPIKAVRSCRSILANSNRAIKIAISITDGVWWDAKEADDILMHMRKAGVLTALAYVSNPDWQRPNESTTIDTHGCAIAVNITKGQDLFTLARQMVKVGVASNLAS